MKETLERVNEKINELNCAIGVHGKLATEEKAKPAMQKLKEAVLDAQRDFVKEIERLYYS